MKLGNKGTDVKVSGTVGKLSALKIKATGGAFDILSNGLYNDKIRAVIRELSCNAFDAHIAAGIPTTPFSIHLPTQWEPYFSIRDVGTGLRFIAGGCDECGGTGLVSDTECEACDGTGDYDACKRLYCTYFASDKNDSNSMVGGFGLGSKSPFAYTNKRLPDGSFQSGGFDVTNTYNGKRYLYSALVRLSIPSVVLTTVVDTDEPNGVEVTFPVDPKDIWEFENRAAIVFEFFEPKPVLNKVITFQMAQYSVKTELWGMRKDDEGLRAIMGNVQYTVGNIDQSRLTEAQKKMILMPIDLFFNIGELSPAVSREALQLDDLTIGSILARLDIVRDKLLDEVRAELDACPTGWEARFKLMELRMQSGVGVLVNDALAKGTLFGNYTNFKLVGESPTVNELDYNFITLVEFSQYKRNKGRKKAKKDNLFKHVSSMKRSAAMRDVAADVTTKDDYDIKIMVDRSNILVINDIRSSCDRYVHYLLQSDDANQYETAIVINKVNAKTPLNRVGDEAVTLLESLGNPPALRASDLKAKYDPLMKAEKDEASAPRVRQKKLVVRVLRSYLKRGRYRWGKQATGWKKAWNRGETLEILQDPTVPKFYLLVDKTGEVLNKYGIISDAYSFLHFANRIRETGVFKDFMGATPVFGLREDSPLLNDPSFFPLIPYLKDEFAKILTPEKQMEMSLAVHPFTSQWESLLVYIARHPQVMPLDSPIRQFANTLEAAKQADRTGHTELVRVAEVLGVPVDNDVDFNKQWSKLLNYYPCLKVFSRNHYSGVPFTQEATMMVDYLRYVEQENKKLVMSTQIDVELVSEDTTLSEEEQETVNA